MTLQSSISKLLDQILKKNRPSIPEDIEPKSRKPPPHQLENIETDSKEIRLDSYITDLFSIEAIHSGGMGKVYIARRKRDGKRYALKTILMEKAKTEEDKEKLFERFRWESQVWVVLGKHRNIVQSHWFDTDVIHSYQPLLVMEYVEGDAKYGVSLRDWIRVHNLKDQKLPLPFILNIAIEVLTGLLYAKKVMEEELNMKFVHRDLKPENILITKDGIAKVTDFGLVKAFGEVGEEITLKVREGEGERVTFIATKSVCGTPAYMAPEQWKVKEPDERADVYALGCIVYEMITGRPPFIGFSASDYKVAHLNNTPKPPQRESEKVPDALNSLILKCLSKETTSRPKLSELREELQEIHQGLYGVTIGVKDEGEVVTVWDWNDRGNGFANLGFHRKALFCHDHAVELNPQDEWAYNNRGLDYEKLGHYERAIEDYNRAIELNPRYAEAYLNRGVAYYEACQYERAIEDYNKDIEFNPRFAWAYMNRGNAYSALGQKERAIEDYDKAIKLNPRYADAYLNRGAAYYDLGQYERAMEDSNRAIELNPKDGVTYYNRAETYEKLNQPKEAIKDYRRFINLASPQHAQYVEEAKKKIEELKGR